VNHLDVVTCSSITDPFAARLTITLGSNALENVLDVWPRLLISTRHDRRTISGTLLTTGHTTADESDSLSRQVLASTLGIGVMRVSTIDYDVAFLEVGEEGFDEVVDGLARHDQEHHAAWLLQLGAEFLDGVGAFDRFAFGFVGEEVVDFGDGAIECNDVESVVSGVEDQILTHNGQTDQAEVSSGDVVSILLFVGDACGSARMPANVYAGQALTEEGNENMLGDNFDKKLN
jgi:hypothetical protein